MILKLKNGSGIHIKKKNRGKFTAYCGGNVTSACIAKAKASGNPTLVKRATFADNARKWKHLHGGLFKRSNLSFGLQFAATFPFLYALGKAVDPTGISGYSDVKKADKEWGNNPSFSSGYNVAMETLGALPIISTGSRIWRALLGFVTGNGFIKDYKEASNLSDLYMNELVIDYFDNTVKPRKEFEKHSQHVDYTDANHLPSPELAPKGSKVGLVIANYDYKYKNHYNYKKYVKHLNGGLLTSNIDNRSDTTRKGFHEGLPALGAADAPNTAGLLDLLNYNITKNPYIITGAPDILPGKVGTIKKSILSVSNANDKGLTVTKKLNTSVKNGLTYEDFDTRHVNAGRNKYTKALRERALYMITNSYPNSSWYKLLLDILKKLARKESTGADKKVIQKFTKQRYDVLDNFINSGFFR